MTEEWMKICIADNQSRVRYGLRILLEQQPGWHVIGEVANAIELIERVRCDPPDVVLLDWELPGMSLGGLLTSLREACPELLVISLSGRYELRQPALKAGADAFANKAEPPEKLIHLIRQLMNQECEML
jgi:DNA-binding NarL/FixJ family response regulator